MRHNNRRNRNRRGFWGWFSSLTPLEKWGLLNLTAQLGIVVVSIAAPQVAAAMAGGAALGFATQVLGVDHVLVGLLKSAAPGLGAMLT
jgi:hypothetical protein